MKYVDDSSLNLLPTLHLFNYYLLSVYYKPGNRDRIVTISGKAESVHSSEKTVKTICLFY